MPEFDAVAELELPATLAVLAHDAETLPPRAAMADCQLSTLIVWLAIREHGPIECRALYPEFCSSGSVTASTNTLVSIGRIERYRRPQPTASDIVWDPTVATLDPEASQQAAIRGEPITDGGTPTVTVCPECDTGGLERRDSGELACTKGCGVIDGEPIERPDRRCGPKPRGLAAELDRLDAEDVLPDGGHPTTQPDREHMRDCSVSIPPEQVAQLDTLVDVGCYPNRSEAIRDGIRRILRLHAADPDPIAKQTQHAYTRALQGRRPETIGALEELADRLGVDLHREVSES